MKLSIKSILPIALILLLIILLVGCVGIFAPTSTEEVTIRGSIRGRIIVIRRSVPAMVKDVYGIIPVPNAIVTLIDSEGVVHTVTTDEDGYYIFTDVAPGTNYIIDAVGMVNGKRIVYRDFVEEVIAGEDYDAGIAEQLSAEPEPIPIPEPEPIPEPIPIPIPIPVPVPVSVSVPELE